MHNQPCIKEFKDFIGKPYLEALEELSSLGFVHKTTFFNDSCVQSYFVDHDETCIMRFDLFDISGEILEVSIFQP